MWIVNATTRSKKEVDPDFMPFPEQFNGEESDQVKDMSMPLANKAMVMMVRMMTIFCLLFPLDL